MKFKLRISKLAIRDIKSVAEFTREHFGAKQERAYLALIGDALKDILADPYRSPAKHRPELHPEARMFHIARRGRRASHLFLYRIRDEVVEVARLLHDSMELRQHLPEGFAAED